MRRLISTLVSGVREHYGAATMLMLPTFSVAAYGNSVYRQIRRVSRREITGAVIKARSFLSLPPKLNLPFSHLRPVMCLFMVHDSEAALGIDFAPRLRGTYRAPLRRRVAFYGGSCYMFRSPADGLSLSLSLSLSDVRWSQILARRIISASRLANDT